MNLIYYYLLFIIYLRNLKVMANSLIWLIKTLIILVIVNLNNMINFSLCLEFLKNINITLSEKTDISRVREVNSSFIIQKSIVDKSRLMVVFCSDFSLHW